MTTITLPRAIVEQALEALKFCTPNPRSIDDDYAEQGWKEHIAAITALRAALAQQAEPVQEPITRLFGTLPVHDAQQAEPVESVAWRAENANPPGGYVIFQQYPQALADLGKPIQPLYTTPPQRKPLTEEEIDALPWNGSPRQFARAVEKASWEKNHG